MTDAFYAGYEHRGPSVSEELPRRGGRSADPTVLAKLDAAAPIPAVQTRRSRPPEHDGRRRRLLRRRLSRQRLEHRRVQPGGPPDPALRHGHSSARPAVSRWTPRAVRCSSPNPAKTRSRSSSPKKKRRHRRRRALRAEPLPALRRTARPDRPIRRTNRIPLPLRHHRLRAEPVLLHRAAGSRRRDRQPASATKKSASKSGPHARHRLLLPPHRNKLPRLSRAAALAQHLHDAAIAQRAARRPRLGDGLPAGKARRRADLGRPLHRRLIQAAVDGDSIAWLASGPVLAEVRRAAEASNRPSSSPARSRKGGAPQSLETPHEQGRGLLLPSPSEYHYFSPDLSQSLLQPTEPTRQVGGVVEHPALSPEASEKTIYLRHDPPAAPDFAAARHRRQRHRRNTSSAARLEFLGASSDLSHVIFESKVGLTASAPAAAGLYEWEAGSAAEAHKRAARRLPGARSVNRRGPRRTDARRRRRPERARCDLKRRQPRDLE